MFDIIGGHYLKNYDWFYIMPDSTYVRGRKLHEMVKHTSMNQDVYIGNRTKTKGEERFCSFESGLLLSHVCMAVFLIPCIIYMYVSMYLLALGSVVCFFQLKL